MGFGLHMLGSRLLGKIFQWIWWITGSAAILTVLLCAIFLNVARLATPWLNRHPQRVQQQIESVWPGTVKFKTMHWSWSWFSPQVVLSDVTVASKAQDNSVPESLHINNLSLSLNLVQTLIHWHLHLNAVNASGASIIVRQQRDGYLVNGYFIPKHNSDKPITIHTILQAFSAIKVGQIQLSQIHTALYLLQHDPIHIQLQNVFVIHQHADYQLHGLLSVSPDHVKSLQFWMRANDSSHTSYATLQINNAHIHKLQQWAFVLPLLKRLNVHWQSLFHSDAHLNGTIWLKLYHDQITKMQSQFMLNQIQLTAQKNQQAAYLGSFSTHMAFVRSHLHWSFVMKDSQGVNNNKIYSLGDIMVSYQGGSIAKRQWSIAANHLNLAMFSQPVWIRFLSGFPKLKPWAALRPHGYIDFLKLQLGNYALHQWSKVHFQIQAVFDNASWHAVKHFPGVENLQGTIIGDDRKGKVDLSQNLGEIYIKGVFQYPWILKQSKLNADWLYQNDNKKWQINMHQLNIDDGHLKMQTTGVLNGQGKHAPVGNLHGSFSLNNTAFLEHYLPLIKLKPKIFAWLSKSFLSGYIDNGVLTLRGPLNKFPFMHQEGHLLVTGALHKMKFQYDPQWPVINNFNGLLTFKNDRMEISQASASMPFIQINNIQADIPHLKTADLDMHGDLSGDLSGIDQFFVNTPLPVGQVFQTLKGYGDFIGALHLNLPIKHLSDQSKIEGDVQMQDATWNAPAWSAKLTHAKGSVQFTQSGVTTNNLTGMLFNAPTLISMKPVLEKGLNNPVQKINLSGTYSVPLLVNTYLPVMNPFVKGSTPVAMNVSVFNPKDNKDTIVNMRSNLKGVSVLQFPDGLSKSPDEKRSYSLTMHVAPKKIVIDSLYGKNMRSESVLVAKKNQFQVRSSHIMIGDVSVPSYMNTGLAVAVKAQQSDLDTWYALYEKYIVDNNTSMKNPLLLNYVSAQIAKGSLFNQNLTNIHAEVKRSKDEWDWRVASSRVNGEGNLPTDSKSTKPWEINLKYAHFRAFKFPHGQSKQSSWTYSDIPSMKTAIEEFSYLKYNLHHLQFSLTHPKDDAFFINNIHIGDQALNVIANMRGLDLKSKNPYWHIDGKVEGNNFGSGLAELGLPVHLKNTIGTINVNAYVHNAWPVAAWKKIENKITANVSIALENGSIIGLSPSVKNTLGALKLLNTLSIQALPEKLSGKYSMGTLYFNNIKGSATLKLMHWQVPNVTLKSSELSAVGSGYGQLDKQSVKFWIKVQPHLTGSVPVLAAFAGGPVVGIASWFVNKLFVSPVISNAAAKSFYISGHWPNIKVRTLHAKAVNTN